jgi:hypothetical protein
MLPVPPSVPVIVIFSPVKRVVDAQLNCPAVPVICTDDSVEPVPAILSTSLTAIPDPEAVLSGIKKSCLVADIADPYTAEAALVDVTAILLPAPAVLVAEPFALIIILAYTVLLIVQ